MVRELMSSMDRAPGGSEPLASVGRCSGLAGAAGRPLRRDTNVRVRLRTSLPPSTSETTSSQRGCHAMSSGVPGGTQECLEPKGLPRYAQLLSRPVGVSLPPYPVYFLLHPALPADS